MVYCFIQKFANDCDIISMLEVFEKLEFNGGNKSGNYDKYLL